LCTRRSAISSRSANERYRPDSGFADGRNIAGGMPPAFRNNLVSYSLRHTSLSRSIFTRYACRDRRPEPPLLISSCYHRTTWREQWRPTRPIRTPPAPLHHNSSFEVSRRPFEPSPSGFGVQAAEALIIPSRTGAARLGAGVIHR